MTLNNQGRLPGPDRTLKRSESTPRGSGDALCDTLRQECLFAGCGVPLLATRSNWYLETIWQHGDATMKFPDFAAGFGSSAATFHMLAVLKWLRKLHSGVVIDGEYREVRDEVVLPPQDEQRALPPPVADRAGGQGDRTQTTCRCGIPGYDCNRDPDNFNL